MPTATKSASITVESMRTNGLPWTFAPKPKISENMQMKLGNKNTMIGLVSLSEIRDIRRPRHPKEADILQKYCQ